MTSSDLKTIAALLEKKEELENQIEEINARLKSYQTGEPVAVSRRAKISTPRGSAAQGSAQPSGKAGRGELKEKVVSALRSAGKDGLSVKDLADRIGTTYGNIYAFFQSTAKRITTIKKVAPGTFAWVE
ncbi:MAG: hypothetical protein ACRD2G_10600 [Terriglobia bacterium]